MSDDKRFGFQPFNNSLIQSVPSRLQQLSPRNDGRFSATVHARSVSTDCPRPHSFVNTNTTACHCGYRSKSHAHRTVCGSVSSR
ncbi:hypothetical protein AFLA_010158 [Aspergillus flavus NRRL3357]|nr:hypothetical protein AFLA_010158 [Aspergillus flavus NRRL3357]